MKKIVVLHGVYIAIIIMSLAFAFVQKTIATQQRELANKYAIEAEKNAKEALRQQRIAEENADEAFRQISIAEENAEEAVRQQQNCEEILKRLEACENRK